MMALTMALWKLSPGAISRLAIQHEKPRFSSAEQIVLATFRSFDAKLMNTLALMPRPHTLVPHPR
jgi:hypothetical protein